MRRPPTNILKGIMNSKRITLPTVAVAAALVLSGCSAGFGEADRAYCVDKDDRVVSEEHCDQTRDGTSAGFWFLAGRFASDLKPGSKIDSSQVTSRIAASDAAGRTAAGIGKTGIVNGSVASGKAGFGSGAGKSGGFGHGGFGG